MGSLGHRLLAVVIASALAVLLRPSGAFATDGPVAVNCVESDDVSLHTPRRAATSLDRVFREFIGSIADVTATWGMRGPCVGAVSPSDATATESRSCGPWRPQPRGPPRR